MYRLDFRGYPEIEGAVVFKENKMTSHFSEESNLEDLVGIVMPGMFHNSSYREYLTIMMDFKLLANNIAQYLFPLKVQELRTSNSKTSFNRLFSAMRQSLALFKGSETS